MQWYAAPLYKLVINQHKINIQTYFSKNLNCAGVKNDLPRDQQDDVSNNYNKSDHEHPWPRNLDEGKYVCVFNFQHVFNKMVQQKFHSLTFQTRYKLVRERTFFTVWGLQDTTL